MARRVIHVCLDVAFGIENAEDLRGCITVNGKRLTKTKEIRAFLREQLEMGRRVIPVCDCDNFDYQLGCRGHVVSDD